jgi:hypothetical protein
VTAADIVIADRPGEVLVFWFTDSFESSTIVDSLQKLLEFVFVFVKRFDWLVLYSYEPFCELLFGQVGLGFAECFVDLPQMFLYPVG